MKKILRVTWTDIKRISNNVVALVIIMGLSIIPALYAWFNIMSNWDPYGENATSSMKIAILSQDAGFSYGNVSVNVGDKIVSGLESNNTIDWQFHETLEESLAGVYNGEYYAALVIPENFTVTLMSFLGGEPVNPTIQYYENSKKNAIATKITSKVRTTVQQSVNATVITSLTEIGTKSGEVLTGENTNGEDAITVLTKKLEQMDRELGLYAGLLNGFVIVTDASGSLLVAAEELLPSMEGVLNASGDSINGMKATLESGSMTAESLASIIELSLNSVEKSMSLLKTQVEAMEFGVDLDDLLEDLDTANQQAKAILDSLEQFRQHDGGEFDGMLDTLQQQYNQFSSDIETLRMDVANTKDKMDLLKSQMTADIDACIESIRAMKATFENGISSELNFNLDEIEKNLTEAQTLLYGISDEFPEIKNSLEEYQQILASGTADIANVRDYIYHLQEGIRTIVNALEVLRADANYEEVVGLLSLDPELISAFVASPISMETTTMYEITNYGSAMAPFYTVLALWVGGLILVALLHVKVKECPEVEGTKNVHRFFGRYILFFLVGQAQTLITVFGNLFFLRIQCPHPVKFWFAAAVASFMFSFFMYALTVAWGNVGQAIAVIVMVIQVAGAGGTFPIEVLPKAYQVVYPYLPFTHAMNALRECVGGMYGTYYWKCLGVLGIYILISIVIGLFCGKPFGKLTEKLEESKKKSGIML